jgi:hypothetical protein
LGALFGFDQLTIEVDGRFDDFVLLWEDLHFVSHRVKEDLVDGNRCVGAATGD